MHPKQPTAELPEAPTSLKVLQTAFGQAMAMPFRFLDDSGAFATRHESYPEAITGLIKPLPNKGLDGAQRLATYNCQYWFRLFSTLHKEMPLLRHLMGTADMNRLTTAYLTTYPSTSYDLRHLTFQLARFLEEDSEYDLPIIQQAARLDCLYILAFDAPFMAPLRSEDLAEAGEGFADEAFTFQAHWFLFEEDWPLVAGRKRAAPDDDDKLDIDVTPGKGYWAVYRNVDGVVTEPLGPLQFYLLQFLDQGMTLSEALTTLAEALDEEALTFLGQNVQAWFATWVAMGWICKKP